MTPSNRAKLESYRPKLREWVNDQTCHLDGIAKQEILNIIREEFNSGYQVDLWCGHCVVKMMEYAFREMDNRDVVRTDRAMDEFINRSLAEDQSLTETITVNLLPDPILYKKKKK